MFPSFRNTEGIRVDTPQDESLVADHKMNYVNVPTAIDEPAVGLDLSFQPHQMDVSVLEEVDDVVEDAPPVDPPTTPQVDSFPVESLHDLADVMAASEAVLEESAPVASRRKGRGFMAVLACGVFLRTLWSAWQLARSWVPEESTVDEPVIAELPPAADLSWMNLSALPVMRTLFSVAAVVVGVMVLARPSSTKQKAKKVVVKKDHGLCLREYIVANRLNLNQFNDLCKFLSYYPTIRSKAGRKSPTKPRRSVSEYPVYDTLTVPELKAVLRGFRVTKSGSLKNDMIRATVQQYKMALKKFKMEQLRELVELRGVSSSSNHKEDLIEGLLKVGF